MLPSKLSEDIGYFDAIQIISLNNLFRFRDNKPTTKEYDYGRIFRYYSKNFHTPLHEVYALPLHDVITAYFDDLFESLDPEELETIRQDLIKTKIERKEDEDKEEGTLFKIMQNIAKEADEMAKKVQDFNKNKLIPKKPANPPKLPDIKLKFDENGDLDPKSLGLLDP